MISSENHNLANKNKVNFIGRLKICERDAVNTIVKEFHGSLFKAAKAQKLSDEMADEAVAETWGVFFEKFDKFEQRSKIKTYLSGILINKVREERRKNKKVDLVTDPIKFSESECDHNGLWVNKPLEPDKVIETKEKAHQMQTCFEKLSEKQKNIYKLRINDNMTYNEISSILNIDTANLKVSMHRLKNQMKECLKNTSS
jgi:RNA polymerase sigma-70 factor (ECF subfamily)